jgi:hypothetical protein
MGPRTVLDAVAKTPALLGIEPRPSSLFTNGATPAPMVQYVSLFLWVEALRCVGVFAEESVQISQRFRTFILILCLRRP